MSQEPVTGDAAFGKYDDIRPVLELNRCGPNETLHEVPFTYKHNNTGGGKVNTMIE